MVFPDHTHLYNCIESGRLSMTYLNQDFEADIHIIQDFEADIHIIKDFDAVFHIPNSGIQS